MACPSPERLVDFVDGRLPERERLAIESHIDGCEDCRVAASAICGSAGTMAMRSASLLGRYELGDQIGAGGMGVVYRAWDPALSRDVAVKVVKSDDRDLRTRLASEAKSLARLNHPNVCQVYDVGGNDGGEVWIAMELVRGPTLRGWLQQKPARGEILAMLAQAGRGIAAAHEAGMVHRDIKPENILIDRGMRAVVSDFGLARATQDRATRTSVLAGTPAYMAPEQLDGSPADERSDQYAFAVTVHEALIGVRPRPRNRASDAFPARLRTALDRALADDPATRYRSITELLDAIDVAERKRSRALPVALAAAGVVAFVATGVVLTRHGATGDETKLAATTMAGGSPGTNASGTNAPGNSSSGTTAAGSNSSDTTTAGTSSSGNNPSGNNPSGTTPGTNVSGTNTPGTTTAGTRSSGTNPSSTKPGTTPGTSSSGGASTRVATIGADIHLAVPPTGGPVTTVPSTRVRIDPNHVKGDPSRIKIQVEPVPGAPPSAAPPLPTGNSSHIGLATTKASAGDGAGCLAELAQVAPDDPVFVASAKQLAMTRAMCLMLAGRCTEGRRAMREAEQALAGGTLDERQLDHDVDGYVMSSCRAGDMTDRDRMLRAIMVLDDHTHKASVAECRAAYADALRLAPGFANAENHDLLFDVARRVRNTAPSCFAHAGDCASAWQVAKDVDVKLPLDNETPTDRTHRSLFSWSVQQECADHDQGPLSDAEEVLRRFDELHEVRKRGKPTAAYCTQRIDAAAAALAKTTSHEVAAMSHELPKLGAVCLALAGDCTAAWQVFSKLVNENEPQRVRSEFRNEVRECKFAAPGKLSPEEQVAWAQGVLEDARYTKSSAATCKSAYDALVANPDVKPRGDIAMDVAHCYAKVDDCATAWATYQDAEQRFSHRSKTPAEERQEFAQGTRCNIP